MVFILCAVREEDHDRLDPASDCATAPSQRERDVSVLPLLKVGVRFEPDWPPEGVAQFSRWAEAVGYDEIWFSEDLPWAGGIAMAATAMACTTTVTVGLGLLPAFTRNVATTAMEIAALARLGPGRLTVALGYGVPAWMEQIGAVVPHRVSALRETLTCLRQLLDGDEVTFSGSHVKLDEVRLGFPPASPAQLLLGTAGPAGLKLAEQHADGIILPEITSPSALEWVRGHLVTNDRASAVAMLAMVNLDETQPVALRTLRQRMQRIVDFGTFGNLYELAGLGRAGDQSMTDEILRSLAVTGSAADAAATMQAWTAAGATSVVLLAGSDDAMSSYRRFAVDVLPAIR